MGAHSKYTPAVAAVLTVLTSSQGLLTTASKRDGKYEYNFGVVVLLAESVKFCVACLLLRKARREVRALPGRRPSRLRAPPPPSSSPPPLRRLGSAAAREPPVAPPSVPPRCRTGGPGRRSRATFFPTRRTLRRTP